MVRLTVVFVANGVKIRRETGFKNGKKIVKPTLNVSKLPRKLRIQSDSNIHMEYFTEKFSENSKRIYADKKAYRSTEFLKKAQTMPRAIQCLSFRRLQKGSSFSSTI